MPPKKHPLLSKFMAANHPAMPHLMAARQRMMGGIGGHGMMMGGIGGHGLLLGGAKKKRATVGHARNQARGAIVRQVMMQHGMTLPQASHYVKVNNISY
jgi:hypothetical protein